MVTQHCMLQYLHTEMRQSLSYWMLALTLHGITMIFTAPSLKLQRMDSMRKFLYFLYFYFTGSLCVMLKREGSIENCLINASQLSTWSLVKKSK